MICRTLIAAMKHFFFIALVLSVTVHVSAQSLKNISNSEFKQQFLDRINTLRQTGCNCGTTYMHPVGPLVWNEQLAQAAKEHTLDMARRNYFSHDSPDGRSLKDRVLNAGYNYNGYQSFAIGDNIALGQQSIDEVMDGWIKSVGHCKNLMNADFKEIGIFEYKTYWVQDFGGRVPFKTRSNARIIYQK